METEIKNEQAGSPGTATIRRVALPVVRAGVLYVWANSPAAEGTGTSLHTLNA